MLELLDGWPFADGRRGRDFFRRYLERDPTFVPENVWLAEERGRPVACVQIFPRRLRVSAPSVEPTLAVGGIGSVFTAREHRRRGLATRLLQTALAQMAERGMALSLLLATRLDWYRRLGFEPWHDERWTLRAGEATSRSAAGDVVIKGLLREDLEAVSVIGDRYASRRAGTVARSKAQWRASLDLAGDPHEDFAVARDGDRIVAYLRCAVLDSRWQALEWGREQDDEPGRADAELAAGPAAVALTELFLQALRRAPREGGSGLDLPPLRDAAVERALAARGLVLEREPWTGSGPPPTWMLRWLAPEKLARALDLEPPANGNAHQLLQRVLPRERFCFWPADRF